MQEDEIRDEVIATDSDITGDVSSENGEVSEDSGSEEEITHVVTEEDLEVNPDLAKLGVEVGEEIILGEFTDDGEEVVA